MGKIRPLKRSPLRITLLILLGCFILFAGFLALTEYDPADVETLAVSGSSAEHPSPGEEISVLSWNIGYGALGDDADFFMDGGEHVRASDKDRTLSNLDGIVKTVSEISPDIFMAQEVDIDSSRSWRVDELERLGGLEYAQSSFARNFKVAFVPFPMPPLGKVDSGIALFSRFEVMSSQRIQLPVPFYWPVSMVNLKRCLLIDRLPLEGSDRELVLIDLHLEAYDDGEGREAQTRMLADLMNDEAEAGNYVIAAGDFNQIFSSADGSAWPAQQGKWQPGEMDVSLFGDGWQFLMDESRPSCRSLDRPYAGAEREGFQYYLIDGFIVSDNIEVTALETLDRGFVFSDHEPVLLRAVLR